MIMQQWRKEKGNVPGYLDRLRPSRRRLIERRLQRVDALDCFGPPGTQQEMPEEEDEVGSIFMFKEEAVCPV